MYCYSHDLGGIRHVLLPVILWQALQSAGSFRAIHLVSIKSFDNGKVAQRLEQGLHRILGSTVRFSLPPEPSLLLMEKILHHLKSQKS